MKKNLKKLSYILLSIGVVLVISVVAANFILKNKVEDFIENKLPENMEGAYSSLSLSVLGGSVMLENPSFSVGNREDNIKYTFINAEKLQISGISYWNYLVKDEIHIGEFFLETPQISYYKHRKSPSDSTSQKPLEIEKEIFLDVFNIKNADITIFDEGKDSTKLHTKNFSLKIKDIHADNKTLSQKIPIEFQNIEAKSDSIFLKASDYENLTIGSFSLENKTATINNLYFKTKYSKSELSQIIKVERDHYDLSIKSISLNEIDFGLTNNQIFVKTEEVIIKNPSLSIFRDKLVADDLSIKPLYSKSLRELPFYLTVALGKIEDGFIDYEEKVKKENNGGSINFKNLNGTFSNVSNTYKDSKKTEIKIEALFMDKTPLSVNWSFDVQNLKDQFIFEGNLGALEADKMNSFTEPNLKVKLEGHVSRTYFTIDGNHDISKTDMKINYSNFKIEVLRKDGENKNKFLSAVVNIFISKDSENTKDHFREGSAEATRDKTKSIFNFLWISIKNALLSCVTG